MYYSYPQQTFQEVPGEITLALSISGCPLRCKNCHSQETYPEDYGSKLTKEELDKLLKKFRHTSCVLFYGGEWNMKELTSFINHIKEKGIKVCLYTGRELPYFKVDFVQTLDYIKVGRYRERKGNLSSPTTNQRFYEVKDGELINKTKLFWKKPL